LVLPAALLGLRLPWQRRLVLAVGSLAVAGLVVAPWVIRNEQRLGTPTVATLQTGTAIAGTNCLDSYYGKRLGSWSFECTKRSDQARISEVALNNELLRDGRRYVIDHPARLVLVVPARILRQWGLYDPIDEARFEAVESRNVTWQLVSWAAYLPIALLAGYGLVLLRRRRVRVLPMIAIIVSVTTTAGLVYGQQRLRVSAEPVLLVAAAVAIVHVAERRNVLRQAPSTDSSQCPAG
jgi:hypothetical protein